MALRVRPVDDHEIETLYQLRLRALAEDPDAFDQTVADAQSKGIAPLAALVARRGRARRRVRLATTGRRLAALSPVDAQHQGVSLLRRAMHPPGPPFASRTCRCARPLR
jgi:hypothetical protein